MSSPGRSGLVSALSISLALHVAGAVWFALRPSMFRPARRPDAIEVTLVPPPPAAAPTPAPAGGGGAERPLVRAPAPDRTSQGAPAAKAKTAPRAAPPRRTAAQPARPKLPPPPQLPQAAIVDSGPAAAAPSAPEGDPLATSQVTAADLGIGAAPGGGAGAGGGRGGGTGTGTGPGIGGGAGEGRSIEIKPRELRRPSTAEMRALYPDEARREGLQARVRLQLLVDASGRVADVRVVRGAGHGFDEAATALARRFVFEPGRRDGRPVPMWITLTYSFELEG